MPSCRFIKDCRDPSINDPLFRRKARFVFGDVICAGKNVTVTAMRGLRSRVALRAYGPFVGKFSER